MLASAQSTVTDTETENAILGYITANENVSVTELIPELSQQFKSSRVRNIYWKLLSEPRIRRSPAGELSIPAC